MLRDDGHDPGARAVGGLYWRYEQWIRNCEAKVDSPLGVYGGFYAIRRKLASSLPPGTILDDMLQPLSVIRQGYRSVLDLRARVYDIWPKSLRGEFHRKVRTLAGNFQLLQLAPWLLSRQNRLRFELISHKLMRLLVPMLLVVILVTSALLANHSLLYTGAFAAQIVFYILAALGRDAWNSIPDADRRAGERLLYVERGSCGGLLQVPVHAGATLENMDLWGTRFGCSGWKPGQGLELNNDQPALRGSTCETRG